MSLLTFAARFGLLYYFDLNVGQTLAQTLKKQLKQKLEQDRKISGNRSKSFAPAAPSPSPHAANTTSGEELKTPATDTPSVPESTEEQPHAARTTPTPTPAANVAPPR